ncbi:hypothetical protein [Streptomyces sp. NPDC093260]|uniref:hypothetical protein n=1 Tax=Streptomyces sp. NPDC093260 TaxID=3155073 RepID=UPI003438AFBB
MLVALYRSGPLGQRLAKGYAVAGDGGDRRRGRPSAAAAITADLLARPPRLPALPTGTPLTLRGGPRNPSVLWVDTGRVVLHDPAARTAVAATLAEAVAIVAERVRRAGGALVPGGWTAGGADPDPGLCADLHSLDVVSDVQRELLCNLLRDYSPALIALTGRQLHGPGGAAGRGSARLSRATDQVATRYIASFSAQHLDRVRAGLRRSERLARLESMDVNPLGDAGLGAEGEVTLRLFDAQVSVSSAMAHALLAQAVAMRVRDLEWEGRRIRALPQSLLERNRSRAVAHGLAAEFDVDQRPPGGRPGAGARNAGARGGRNAAARPAAPKPLTAVRAVSGLLRELLPYFRQLDATPDELAQLFLGLELAGGPGAAAFVRNENDLLARWHEQDRALLSAEGFARRLASPQWLTTDHITAANTARAAGSTAAARVWLVGQLEPPRPERDRQERPDRQGPSGRGGRPDRSAQRPHRGNGGDRTSDRARGRTASDRARTASGPVLSDEQFLDRVEGATGGADDIVEALRAYCRSTAALDLTPSLRRRGRERAKALRRLLRPRPAERISCDAPLASWDDPAAGRAVRAAADKGWALLHWDLPDAERPRVRAGLRALGRPPGDCRYVLLTDTAYTGKADERRGTLEVLLVAPAREGDPKTAEEAAS